MGMKKKIIIFTSSGGGGHESASKALDAYLKDDYELVHTYIFTQVLYPLDIVYQITFGRANAESFYNALIRKKYFRALNMLALFGNWFFSVSKESIYTLIKNYLIHNKSDLIISVIPYANNEILRAAQELGIPFILIPTDLDATNFVFHIDEGVYKDFWLISAFDEPEIKKIITATHVPEDQIVVGGFPIRKSFFEPKDISAIKRKHAIPEDKPVVFILMGAAGSNVMYQFVQELNNVSFPLHLILVLGRNVQLRPRMEALLAQGSLTATLFDVTDQIADIMAVSEVCISKSGSVSVCESIYSNLPLLLDATGAVLKWESFNHAFIKKHGLGASIESYADIVPLLEQFLTDPKKYDETKQHLADFEKKNLEITLRQLLDTILK